jgi:plasmid maintenance system antidote protein VapI
MAGRQGKQCPVVYLTNGLNLTLLDELLKRFEIKNDRQLSDRLDVAPPVISRIRNKKANASSDFIIRVHEVFGLPIAEIKELLK